MRHLKEEFEQVIKDPDVRYLHIRLDEKWECILGYHRRNQYVVSVCTINESDQWQLTAFLFETLNELNIIFQTELDRITNFLRIKFYIESEEEFYFIMSKVEERSQRLLETSKKVVESAKDDIFSLYEMPIRYEDAKNLTVICSLLDELFEQKWDIYKPQEEAKTLAIGFSCTQKDRNTLIKRLTGKVDMTITVKKIDVNEV